MTQRKPQRAAAPARRPQEKRKLSGFSTVYSATWVVLGTASLGYLGFVANDGLGSGSPAADVATIAERQPVKTAAEHNVEALIEQRSALAEEARRLRDTVDPLRRELEETKARLAELEITRAAEITGPTSTTNPITTGALPDAPSTQPGHGDEARSFVAPNATLDTPVEPDQPRVRTVRTTEIPVTAQINAAAEAEGKAGPPLPERAARAQDAQPARIAGITVINGGGAATASVPATAPKTVAAVPAEAPKARVSEEPKPAAAATRSKPAKAPEPITFGAPIVVAATPPQVALRLSTGPSVESLRLSWQLLQERHNSILQGLEPKYQPDGGSANRYELLAGPMASRAEADQVCTILRAQSVQCGIATFSGDPL